MKAIRTELRHPKFGGCTAEFSVSYDNPERHQKDFGMVATVVIRTGACTVQAYGTPDELCALAESLMKAADAVEAAQAAEAA